MKKSQSSDHTRRKFLETSGVALAGGALSTTMLSPGAVHASGSSVLRVGLVGCGGRGTGAAAQALTADPQVELVAMGDTFADRVEQSYGQLKKTAIADRVKVDRDHRFSGFNAYQAVIDQCDVVLLATPPHFRPEHLKACVDAGKHVFVEKPVAVDGSGVRSVMETCKKASEKGLNIVSGLCWRYHYGMRETFQQILDGAVGEIMALQCTYNTSELWYHDRQPEWSDMEWQVRNWLYFTWLSGDHIVEQHIHSLDKMVWAMGGTPPNKCVSLGGRQVRTSDKYGQIFDHFNTVYEYDGGVKCFSSTRQQDGCAMDVSDHVLGTQGTCDVFRHSVKDHTGKTTWRYRGPNCNMYQVEHDELFAAIRAGEVINNGDYMCKSTLMAIMARMAAYSGQEVTWDQALNSPENLTPEKYEWGPMKVAPIAIPGLTQLA